MTTPTPLARRFDAQVLLLERPWWGHGGFAVGALVMSAVCLLAIVPLALAAVEVPGIESLWLFVAPWVGALAFLCLAPILFAIRFAAGETRRAVRLSACPDGLFLDGVLVARLDSLNAGYLAPHDEGGGGMLVQIHRPRRKVLRLIVPGYDEARALLCAVGLDVTQRDVVFRTASRVAPYGADPVFLFFSFWFAFFACWKWQAPTWWMFAAMPGLFFVYGILGAHRAKLEVRRDGILLRWLGTRRFVAYGEMAPITNDNLSRGGALKATTIELPLLSGGRMSILVAGHWLRANAQAPFILERIREAAIHAAGGNLPARRSR